ncbi:T9SS type A sorting domain-containing protein [Flavivirga aquimarina]|uniref:T9SS type A sorting domain-containing protein n=1 Tax=Flavivirga aquimarina TaxID=2027862 RepID=A0ABT8W5K6_9FLAO|nr:T9SS type A sorting domain-containing protein [Flavivirga aquimarina]MDO5968349.1 T9SS type A sorting domain-containing protein [Flavivirga aquimarina]
MKNQSHQKQKRKQCCLPKKLIPLLILMLLFNYAASYAQVRTTKDIYVDLQADYPNTFITIEDHGDGTSGHPYDSLGTAVYFANQYNNDDNVDITIHVRGTADTVQYLTFDEGKSTSTITVKAWSGFNFIINHSNAGGVGLSITLGTLQAFTLGAVTVTGGYYENYGILINVINRNQPTVTVENCEFNNISWTADASIADSPPDYNSYLYPIYLIADNAQVFGLNNNTFTNVAVGYGHLIGLSSRDGLGLSNLYTSLETTGSYNSNTATGTILPFSAATATEFYVDASVPAGTSGYGGNGSESDPWKYLTSANFGAIFNDWSTVPATKVDKDVTVYFREGTHTLTSIMYLEGVTQESSLTLQAYPGEIAVLDGSNLTGQFTSMIACHDCYNTTVKGLKLTGLTTDVVSAGEFDTRFGIIFNGFGDNINILNNEIYEMHWTNDAIKKLNPLASNNLGAIQVVGTDSTPISNVTISGNNIHDITPGYTEALTVNGNVDGFTISDNTITDIANIGIVAAGNYEWVLSLSGATLSSSQNYSRNGIISGNAVRRCISPVAVSAGIYLDGSRNIEVANNSSSHNGVGMSVGNEVENSSSGGHRIHDNTFANNLLAGMYIGSTSNYSNVDDVEVYNNLTYSNFNQDPTYLALTNGNYGGDIWFDVEMTQVTNLKFHGNQINPNSNYILNKRYAETHSGHDYYNNTYTIPVSHADLQPTFRDETSTNEVTLYDWEGHKNRNLDDVGSTLDGSYWVTGGYDTSEITITELSPLTTHEIIALSTNTSEVEIDAYHKITNLHSDLTNKGYSIVHALDDYSVESSENQIHFLAPASYGTDGFPSTHPMHGFTNVERVLQSAASLNVYDGNTTEVLVYDLYKRGGVTEVLQVPTNPNDSDEAVHDHNDFILLSHKVSRAFWDFTSSAKVYVDEAFSLTEHAIKFYEDAAHGWTCSRRALNNVDLLVLSECILDQNIQNPLANIVLEAGGKVILTMTEDAAELLRSALPYYTTFKKFKDYKFCVQDFVEYNAGGNCYSLSDLVLVAVGVYSRSELNAAGEPVDTTVNIDLNFPADSQVAGILGEGMTVYVKRSDDDGTCSATVENIEIASPVFVGASEYVAPEVYKFESDPISGELKDILSARPYIVSVFSKESSYVLPWLSTGLNATTNIEWEYDTTSETCALQEKISKTSNTNSALPMIIGVPEADVATYLARGWSLLKNNTQQSISIESPFFNNSSTLVLMKLTTGITNPFIDGIEGGVHVWGSENLRTYMNITDVTTDPWTGSSGSGNKNSGEKQDIINEDSLKDETISDSNVLIYPNPVDNKMIIKLKNNESALIQVYNSNGVKIQQLPYNQEHINGLEVDLSTYQTGLYYVRVVTDSKTYTKKIVKQ